MTTAVEAHRHRIGGRTMLHLVGRGLARDKWMITTCTMLLVAAVYASATATPWLYPTPAQRTSAAEAINASPGVVALYGRILDVTSLGELAMTKMTVLYALFVAIVCAVAVRRQARADRASGEQPADSLVAGMVEGAGLAIFIGTLSIAANVAAGLPVAGSVAFGASWIGVGLVAATLTTVVHVLTPSTRAGVATAVAMGALFALRGVGDALSVTWLRWLSPFGWSTQVEAWSNPRWWVLSLYAITAVTLGAVACTLTRGRDATVEAQASWPRHRDGASLAIWTVAAGGMAAYFGAISPDLGAPLGSSNAREMIERLGGDGPLPDVLAGAEFSVIAVAITAFGVSVFNHAAARGQARGTAADRPVQYLRRTGFASTIATALLGSTWLLLTVGVMYSAGIVVAGGRATSAYVDAALDHAPAVWTVVAMTAVAWSLRPAWARAGWGLLILFAAIGPLGKLMSLPAWLAGFSPFARIALVPGDHVDWITTAGLTASSCILLAIAAYNHTRISRSA